MIPNVENTIKRIVLNDEERIVLWGRMKEVKISANIGVSDLVSLRCTYMRRKYPDIPISLEREERMAAGRGLHDIFGRAVEPFVFLERYKKLDDIVGRIDIFRTFPIEVKSTRALPTNGTNILDWRPENVEQLGMYCAMTEISKGQLVYFIGDFTTGGMPDVQLRVFWVEFDDLTRIKEIMIARKDMLKTALETSNPTQLPRAPWCTDKCEYKKVGVCNPDDAPQERKYEIVQAVKEVVEDPAAAGEYKKKVQSYYERPQVRRRIYLSNLIMPKPYVIKMRFGMDEDEALTRAKYGGKFQGQRESIAGSSKEDFTGRYTEWNGCTIPILFHRETPAAIVFPRLPFAVSPRNAIEWLTIELVELGMTCALANKNKGRLISYFENEKEEELKLIVYDVDFRDVQPYREFLNERIELLSKLKNDDDFRSLPDCPNCEKWRGCRVRKRCKGENKQG